MRSRRVLALVLTLSLASAVAVPPGFALGSAGSVPGPRPATRSATAPAKSASSAAMQAPVCSGAASTSRSPGSAAAIDTPILVDPLAPAVPGEIVVVLDEGASTAGSALAIRARGASVERVPGNDGTLLVRTPRGIDDPVFSAIIGQSPGVDRVQPNYIYSTSYTPSDTYYPAQWGLPKIGAPAAWDITQGSGAVLVAVVDTGVDRSHPDLVDRVDTVNDYDYVNGDTNAGDDNGHGTHVAGIVAASDNGAGVVGVAPGCRILPMKVLDAKGSGNTIWVAAGIRRAADSGAQIINLSLAGPSDPSMAAAVAYALAKGCVVVAAAGNDGSSTGADYPARYDGVVGVGAIERNSVRASFSNYGPDVDVAAPGVGILSTVPGGRYASWSGTSMAAPFVAGVAALVLSSNPSYDAEAVVARVQATAQQVGSFGDDYRGLVRADLAVAAVEVSADDEIPGIPLEPSPVSGELGVTDANDVLSVYLGEGQSLEASLTGAARTDFDLLLFAPDTETIASGALAYSRLRDYPEHITYAAPATGWYYLNVTRYSGDGSYVLTWERTGLSNDNLPGVALPSTPVTGTLDSDGDLRDIYRFDLEAGDQLAALMTGPDNADYDLWLYGPGSTSIDVDAPLAKRISPESWEYLRYVATEAGTYSVMVYAYAGAGDYQLDWSQSIPEPDDNIPGVAVSSSGTMSSVIGGLADMNDAYKIYLQAGQSVEVTLTDTSAGTTDPNLCIFDPTCTDVDADPWVAQAESPTATTEPLRYTAEATGYHYLDVYSGGDPGGYRLDWSTSANPDDNVVGALDSPPHAHGALGVTTDTDDVYRVRAYAGQRITASLTGSAETDFDLYLFAPGSADVRTDAPASKADGGRYPKTISFEATRTGDYYLLAHAFSGEGTYAIDWSAKSYPRVTIPYASSKVGRSRYFTVHGYVSPRHTSGTYLVSLRFYRYERGAYAYHHTVSARRENYSSVLTRYKTRTRLTTSGQWRVRAYHSDAAHVATYSAYRYITVR